MNPYKPGAKVRILAVKHNGVYIDANNLYPEHSDYGLLSSVIGAIGTVQSSNTILSNDYVVVNPDFTEAKFLLPYTYVELIPEYNFILDICTRRILRIAEEMPIVKNMPEGEKKLINESVSEAANALANLLLRWHCVRTSFEWKPQYKIYKPGELPDFELHCKQTIIQPKQ